MSRESTFIPTSPPDERTLLLKDYATLRRRTQNQMTYRVTICCQNMNVDLKHLEHYCLAAFVSDLRIEYPKNVTFEDPFDDNFDDDPLDPAGRNIPDSQVLELLNGIVIKKRRVPRILRCVNYNIKRDPENHYRERLMLFRP